MKARSFMLKILLVCFILCTAFGISALQLRNFSAKADGAVDVTDKVNMNFHSEKDGIVEIDLTFDGVSNVYASGVSSATWVNDHADMGGVDLMQFIKVGDKTARELVNENNAKLPIAQYSGIVNGWGGNWAPVAVLVDNGGIIRIKTLTKYCAYEDLVITLLSDGFSWETSDSVLTLTHNVVFYNDGGNFVKFDGVVDVTERVNMSKLSEVSGTIEIGLTFTGITNIYGSSFWANDHANTGSVDIMQYIKIGDNTARSIVAGNAQVGVYRGQDFPMSMGGVFAPVAIQVESEVIRIKVLTAYCSYENLEITLVSEGFDWIINDSIFGDTHLIISSDKTFVNYKGQFVEKFNRIVVDDKVKFNVNGFELQGAADLEMSFEGITEVRPVDVDAGTNEKVWINDNTKGYGGTDYSRGVDLMEYIVINGRTAREIVEDNFNGMTEYIGESMPFNYGMRFAPIGVCVETDGIIRIKVMNEYLNYTNLRITLKAGLEWRVYNEDEAEFDTLLLTESDITFYYKNGNFIKWDNDNNAVNLSESLQVEAGNITEYYYEYHIKFGEKFIEADTWIMDKQTENPGLYALQNNIKVNGITVKEINDTTDDSEYVYGNLIVNWDSHKVPIRTLFENKNNKSQLTLYIHKDYVAANPIEQISLNDFVWAIYSVKHALTAEIKFDAFTSDGETVFKRECFVTFDGGEPIMVYEGEKLSQDQIPSNPEKENTTEKEYVFIGWYYLAANGSEIIFEPTNTAVKGDYHLYPKFNEVNKRFSVIYYVNDDKIEEQEVSWGEKIKYIDVPEKEFYTGVWQCVGEAILPEFMPVNDIEIHAVYKPNSYKVVFYADAEGKIELATVYYTIEDTDIEEPQVPSKDGFTAAWGDYELNGGDKEVYPLFNAINVSVGSGCNSSVSFENGWHYIAAIALSALYVLFLKKKTKNQE